jgi:single-strand DNA-binding protein
MLNHMVLQGRLTKDPELRTGQSGNSVTTFTVAVERDFSKDKEADFINCVAFGKTAEFISHYFSRGAMIIVSGSLQSRKWEDKQGNKRTDWNVVADHVYFGGSKTNNTTTKAEPSPDVSANDFIDLEDDGTPLPF